MIAVEDIVVGHIVVEDIAVEFGHIVVEDIVVEAGRIAVEDIAVEAGRIVVDDIAVEFGHIVVEDIAVGRMIVGNNLSVASCKIARKIVEPPADSFGVLLAVKLFAHVPDLLELAGRLGKCSSRALSAGRKLDWHSGRHPLEVVWNFAACAP